MISRFLLFGRRLLAERKAGQEPYSVPSDRAEEVLDGALRRLGAITPEDPLWKAIGFGAGALITRPEEFHKPHVREWLSDFEVKAALKSLTKAQATGGPQDPNALNRLIDTYMSASGEDRQHAERVVATALAALIASLQSAAADAGTAALVQVGFAGTYERFGSVEKSLGELAARPGLFADGVLAEHHGADAKRELDSILGRRTSVQQDTLRELRALYTDLGERGRYRAAPASVKADVLYWLARTAAAQGEIAEAERALGELATLGPRDTAIVNAWLLVARDDLDSALQVLRDRQDADARTVLFAILRRKKGLEYALTWYDALENHPPSQFTGPGWRAVAAALIEGNRFEQAANLVSNLPSHLVTECPVLGYVEGLIYAALFVPEAHRNLIIEEEFLAVTDHLLEGAEADRCRQRSVEAFGHARAAADFLGDKKLVSRIDSWLRWLRLVDPTQRGGDIAALKAAMADGALAVDLIGFAAAFGVDFDPGPLERHLVRQQQLGGLSRRELAARVHLLRCRGRYQELAVFVEENWERLAEGSPPAALGGLLIESYSRCGECGRAEDTLLKLRDKLYPLDVPRFELMIDQCRGQDPTTRALDNYQSTRSYEDLWNLVKVLRDAKRWSELKPFALALFDAEPNSDNALGCVECLYGTRTPEEEVVGFLDRNVELVERTHELASARAWALYHVGRVNEAKQVNDRLLAARRNVRDVGLDIYVAIRTGDWERFTDILGREWDCRADLPVDMLLQLAKLAGTRAPERAIQLAQESVEREPESPNVLLHAWDIARSLARDDLAMPWVQRAAELSREGSGPVATYSFRQMAETMRAQGEGWRRKNEIFREGRLPLHMAAPMFNVPLSRFLIAIAHENENQVDARRRYPIPVRSGARKPIDTKGVNRLVLDITSTIILSELERLDSVVQALEEVYVSPRLMELLLLERENVEFHQPSRVREAKPLVELKHKGHLSVVDQAGPDTLVADVGEALATLLNGAKSRGGVCAHAGKVYKVGSYMDQEAELGVYAEHLVTPAAIAVTLRDEGLIDGATFETATAYLNRVGGEYGGPPLRAGAAVYLDRVAAESLSEAGLLTALVNSGRAAFVHTSAAEEWEALVATERHTTTMVEALERIRRSLRQGMAADKVRFLREGGRHEAEEYRFGPAELPVIDILEDGGRVDAVCIDDRFLNSGPFLEDNRGRRVPLLCTLDILDLLVARDAMSGDQRRQDLNTMRRWGFFALPLDRDELVPLLKSRGVEGDGELRESAELRIIRESLARLHSAEVLTSEADLEYLDHLWWSGIESIRELWADLGSSIDEIEARADWVLEHVMPDVELALRFVTKRDDRIRQLAVARLVALLLPFRIPLERRDAWTEWLERRVVGSYLPANATLIEGASAEIARWVIRRAKEVVDELRRSGRIGGAQDPAENCR